MESSVALAARTSVAPLAGTGAIIYRISSKKQEIKSQYEAVENWLHRRKATVAPTHIFDLTVKRRKTSENLDSSVFWIGWLRDGFNGSWFKTLTGSEPKMQIS